MPLVCDLRVLRHPEDETLFTSEAVTIVPRVGDVLRFHNQEEDFIVTDVWHYYDSLRDRVTALVMPHKKYLEERSGAENHMPAKKRRPKSAPKPE